MQAMPVPVSAVVKKSLAVTLDYSARTEAVARTQLQAKVSGYLLAQLAPDGSDVKAGDLLYRIDSRDYDLALEQARAQLERDTASLDYLKSSLDRGTDLAKSGFLSKDVYDQRTSAVRQAESALAIDRAAIKTAELNRAYTEIRAPFAGRLGRNQASIGTLVGNGGTVLNSLVQIDPVYVSFSPSETDLALIQKARAKGEVPIEVTVPGGVSRRGALTFLDNAVDARDGHDPGPGHHPERRRLAAARAVCPHPGAGRRPAGHPAGAAGGARLESVRQVPVRGGGRREGGAPPGAGRADGRGAGRHPLGRRRERPGDQRQPAEDRPRHAGPARAEDGGGKLTGAPESLARKSSPSSVPSS